MWWSCAEPSCGPTDEPHTRCLDGVTEETTCADHCTYCTSGQHHADQEQHAKEHRTPINPGDPEPGHGLPTREQMAAAEARGPHHPDHMTIDVEYAPEPVTPEELEEIDRRAGKQADAINAEWELISCLWETHEALRNVIELGVTAGDFESANHAAIYDAMVRIHVAGNAPIVSSVAYDLIEHDQLEQVGGKAALFVSADHNPGASHALGWAREVLRHARNTRLRWAARDLDDAATRGDEAAIEKALSIFTTEIDRRAVNDDLEIVQIGELLDRVDARPPVTFLAEPVWPADAYGIIGAEDKLGKTWAILDLAVTVASGGRWLDLFQCAAGPVLAFLGEGGDRKMARRLRAVAEHHEVDQLGDLPLHLCHRVPHLSRADHLAKISVRIDAIKPAVIILDPLYLAAHGAKSSDLFDMGAHLEILQHLAQHADAALVVVHHWNKTGTGTGRARFSGAGSAAWGRVLVSMSADQKTTEGNKSIVHIKAEFVGDEIPDVTHTFTRSVWADDPNDLSSPMHYELGENNNDPVEAATWHGPTDCMAAILTLFNEIHLPPERSKRKTGDDLRAMGRSYRQKTVDDALEQLARDGQLLVREGARKARLFRLPDNKGTLL